jgi:hypothetical protein
MEEGERCYSFIQRGRYVALFQKLVDTPVNGRPFLFRIDSVHQMETSLSHALLVYYYLVYGSSRLLRHPWKKEKGAIPFFVSDNRTRDIVIHTDDIFVGNLHQKD